MNTQTSKLTDNQAAVLEIIARGWYRYLNAAAREIAVELWDMKLARYTINAAQANDMETTDAGDAALESLHS